jgi:hypothetical protein
MLIALQSQEAMHSNLLTDIQVAWETENRDCRQGGAS